MIQFIKKINKWHFQFSIEKIGVTKIIGYKHPRYLVALEYPNIMKEEYFWNQMRIELIHIIKFEENTRDNNMYLGWLVFSIFISKNKQ